MKQQLKIVSKRMWRNTSIAKYQIMSLKYTQMVNYFLCIQASRFKYEIYWQVIIKFSYKSRFYLVFLNWTLVIFVVLELWCYPLGDRFISWKYIKEVGGEVPKGIFDSSWNKIVNTGYQRAQSSYIIQAKLGNKNYWLIVMQGSRAYWGGFSSKK